MNAEEEHIGQVYKQLDLQVGEAKKIKSPYLEKREITPQDMSLISDIRALLEQRVSYTITKITLREALATISATVLKRESLK